MQTRVLWSKRGQFILLLWVIGATLLCQPNSDASPLYSRQYAISCTACHTSPPQLNIHGIKFRETSSLPNWENTTAIDTGDQNTAVPKLFPLSVRAQMLSKLRRARNISDQNTGSISHRSNLDFQTPNFIKLLSSTPLTEDIAFHFDAELSSANNNSNIALHEAWLRYRFSLGASMAITAGQIPTMDVIVDQDTRLTLQEYLIYQQIGLGLDRGGRLDIQVYDFTISLGMSNGTDAGSAVIANSPGIGRRDFLFDNNNRKTLYTYFARYLGNTRFGLFWQVNQQFAATGSLGNETSNRLIYQYTSGLDVQSEIYQRVRWIAQFMWSRWNQFLQKDKNYSWYGGYLGIDYSATDHVAYSLLYNYSNAGDFASTGTIYEGLAANVVTTTVSYFFRSNVRGFLEITMDFLPAENDADFVGHETKEDAISLGIDISY